MSDKKKTPWRKSYGRKKNVESYALGEGIVGTLYDLGRGVDRLLFGDTPANTTPFQKRGTLSGGATQPSFLSKAKKTIKKTTRKPGKK